MWQIVAALKRFNKIQINQQVSLTGFAKGMIIAGNEDQPDRGRGRERKNEKKTGRGRQ